MPQAPDIGNEDRTWWHSILVRARGWEEEITPTPDQLLV